MPRSPKTATPTLLPTIDTPPADDAERARQFAPLLLDWYADKKRNLPWRKTGDPYAVWVSEMMLQQTQVATVIPYWNRWMERFPTVQALADAPLDDVLKLWQGLGYYARARNLHRAAQVVITQHNGVFPTRFDDVLALPGIGRYTAGAVCSIALGQDVPIVDANVIRVLCRLFAVPGDPKSPRVQERLWTLAQELIPSGRASEFNQGMMELGALICNAKPRCGACPVQSVCAAYALGTPDAFPQFAPKPTFTSQVDISAILAHPSGDGRLLLVQRPATGLWGGLWEFPRVTCRDADGETDAQAAERALRETVGLSACVDPTDVLGTVRHGVTTRKITLRALACRLLAPAAEPQTIACAGWDWVAPGDLAQYALSSPQARLVEQIQARRIQPTLVF